MSHYEKTYHFERKKKRELKKRSAIQEDEDLENLSVTDPLSESLARMSIGETHKEKTKINLKKQKIQTLVDMGFSLEIAKKAVKATILSGELSDAIDFITKHLEPNEISTKKEKLQKPSKLELKSEIFALKEALKEEQNMVKDLQNKIKKMSNHSESNSTELCIICEEKEPEMVMLPCAHLCCCQLCSTRINTSGECPICRTKISSILKVYRSGAAK